MEEEASPRFLEAARNLAKHDCQCVWILEDGSMTMQAPGPEAGNYLTIWPSGEVTATSPQRPHRHTATEKREHQRTGHGRRGQRLDEAQARAASIPQTTQRKGLGP
jgi:hypothetical protein